MEQMTTLPLLADVIVKVKQQQELTAEEELVYLIYIEGLPETEAYKLVTEWFEKSVFNYNV